MFLLRSWKAILLFGAVSGGGLCLGAWAQQGSPFKPVEHFHLEKVSLLDGILLLAQEQRIPMGIEYIDMKAVTEPVSMDIGPATVGQVLDSILDHEPGFSWSIREGVICISHSGMPPAQVNLLDYVLKDFSIQRITVGEASLALDRTLSAGLHPGIQGWAGSSMAEPSQSEVGPFSMHDVTVREALNRIVREAGDAAWVVQVPAGNLDKRPSYGLWRIVQYQDPPKSYGQLFLGILRYANPANSIGDSR